MRSALQAEGDKDVHLFFLAGQSNMVGFGNGSVLSSDLLRQLRTLSQPEDPRVALYAAADALGAATARGRETCTFDKMRRGTNFQEPAERVPLAPVEACRWERAITHLSSRFGPELSLGLALHAQW